MLQRFALVLSAAGMVVTVACSQSDSGISAKVKTKLAADDNVKASEVNVDTGKKVVTLNGTVATKAEKDQSVAIARDTKGVKAVIDDIVVNRNVAATSGRAEQKPDAADSNLREKAESGAEDVKNTVTDAAITAAVKAKFLAEPGVSGLKIDVDTSNGVVTLSGTVNSMTEADKAMAIARRSSGVTRVINKMHVG